MPTLFDNSIRNQIRIIVAGGRDFTNYAKLSEIMTGVLERCGDKEIIFVSGCCRGADALGERYASKHGIPVQRVPAEWAKHGKAAGPIRNKIMATYASEGTGILVAFWNGKSRGTASMIQLAKRFGLQTKIVTY